MDCGITTAAFVKIHEISDVKEMEYCKGSNKRNKIKGNMRKRSYLQIKVYKARPRLHSVWFFGMYRSSLYCYSAEW
ncbi:hypothetical protein IGI04_007300 [Brassica rapa subsp. trilocularis]|uniref:Uncharacterized protein n=1 Tax=Brassica rapa subsp. trilocularis TaxID=1813537 RepID=A0ABQ7NKK8_BRACM|nr:hypothetical protein IGI04_007300 [Brassica rapa subsp. trilocularis]